MVTEILQIKFWIFSVMQKTKITIVSYNWPPRNAIGTHRPYHWAKCWSQVPDVEVTVLTAKKYAFDEPLDLNLPLLNNVKVIEVPFIKNNLKVRKFNYDFLKKIKNLLSKFFSRPIDIRNGWVLHSQPFLKEIAENTDIVISTYGPAASHIIGSQIKILNPNCYFVADYRDLWSLNHLSNLNKKQKKYESRRELETISNKANLLSTVSQDLANQLEEYLKIKTLVVPNGFDLNLNEVKNNLTVSRNQTKKITICYTGRIYIGHRDPTPLFKAVEELIMEKRIKLDSVVIDIYGAGCKEVEDILRKNSNFSKFVKLYGHVDRDTVLKVQKEASLLLLLESSDSNNQGVLTGKVFEYIATGVPILSLGSLKESAIDKLLTLTGTGVCVQNEILLIKNIILSELNGDNSWFKPDFKEISSYSRMNQSEVFLNKIMSLKNGN